MRSLAREGVYKYIFSKLFNPSDEGLFGVLVKDLSKEDKEFAKELLTAVENGQEKFLQSISELSVGFSIDRVFNTDKCAILIGMAELDNFVNTPTAVIIDEAVKLVSKFSTEKSTYYVNGILGEYARGRNDE